MKKLIYMALAILIQVALFSCTPEALTEVKQQEQMCCGDDGNLPPPPPPPPPPGSCD